jgi:hypothetical protein
MIVHSHDVLRDRIEKQIRPKIRNRPSLDELRSKQWSPSFERLMRNRLVVGDCRYETFDEKRRNNKYKIIESIKERLAKYETTGNQEHLVDCANLLMIEFECPTHSNPHFEASDDGKHVEKQ